MCYSNAIKQRITYNCKKNKNFSQNTRFHISILRNIEINKLQPILSRARGVQTSTRNNGVK
jgi:hypothetical protein